MPFRHFDLKLVTPDFGSELTDLVMELEHLRRLRLGGSTPPFIFFQLKEIFHLLESLRSARIEGNRTTVSELVEAHLESVPQSEAIREIQNMTAAMSLVEENVQEGKEINRGLIRELHKRTVDGLNREGDRTPGDFRQGNVTITGSEHIPPDYVRLDDYLDEFLKFINDNGPKKFDLIRTALAHHRFAWIHPFNNGNGRVVRLITYAMLIKQGFNVRSGRILNPSAVFCSNRVDYYTMLSRADEGGDQGLLAWCEYVLRGIRDELEKIDMLLDYETLSTKIIRPAIDHARTRDLINQLEHRILSMAIDKQHFKALNLSSLMPQKSALERSRMISRLKNSRLIIPVKRNARRYTVNFANSHLLRGVVDSLAREGFIATDD